MNKASHIALHAAILAFVFITLVPFAFVFDNSFRTNFELYRSFFGLPQAVVDFAANLPRAVSGSRDPVAIVDEYGGTEHVPPRQALAHNAAMATKGYRTSWAVIRPYMINSLVVCLATACGVVLLGSLSAYVLSRFRFFGSQVLFYFMICPLMIPWVLTFVPSFMLVKELGLLNTYWAMILPYIAGGQVFALFVFKSFFDGLPGELFESARIDGAGHLQLYRHLVVPLSKPVLSVVTVMNIMGTWNNFLWPFVTNTEGKYHVVASGLYVLATSPYASNFSTLFAAYMISSVPLLILFVYATRPFIQGITAGAFKA